MTLLNHVPGVFTEKETIPRFNRVWYPNVQYTPKYNKEKQLNLGRQYGVSTFIG
jgi:hypothetical protein